MIRNRFKPKENECDDESYTPKLLNEFSWDALAIARKKLEMIPNTGEPAKPLTKEQQNKVNQACLKMYIKLGIPSNRKQ